jgi:hypothetical protein
MITAMVVSFIKALGASLSNEGIPTEVRDNNYEGLLVLYELCFQMISHSPYREKFGLYLQAQAEMLRGHTPPTDPRNN